MVSDVRQAIVDKIKGMYPPPIYTIYDEDIPQNFKTPSFLIALIDQDYNKRINTKYKSQLSFDVAFFSEKDSTEIKEDCLIVQENLFRAFDLIGTYRVLGKQATITDNVLHFTFNIKYSEMIIEDGTKMNTQQTTTNL